MASILHIETIVPQYSYTQEQIRQVMHELQSDRKTRHYLSGIYSDSGIHTRYSVLPDFQSGNGNTLLADPDDNSKAASTGRRNQIYTLESGKIIKELALKTFENFPVIKAEDITHVITVSCTGFYNPGPDIQLIQALGLSDSTQRYHLGFMGCYAAFPALKMAKQFCDADPKATVMIVCLELCTLHFKLADDLDTLLANSIFADGAASVIVSNKMFPGSPSLSLKQFNSQIIFEAEKEMAWTIGEYGFDMVLSKYIPKIIGANISDILGKIFNAMNLNLSDIDYWAIHPGGKSIIDKVQESLDLKSSQVQASRDTLRNFGNMSSATVLFVLKQLLQSELIDNQKIYSIAFGPGLVLESALLTYQHN
jgi:predicted naringenin-chalcone synthase